ncbi:MAG TPA: UV DNA damage repair endonuclease UvsE [Vicinamibacterales bacterium]|nr:UV DNA damage repair endonuclease UvsE [Vicinamibacterales bacterium]
MLARLGFVASVLSESLTASRTCRLGNATDERLRELIAGNLAGLDCILDFLARHDIRLYRITSNLIPYASHRANAIPWWKEFGGTLERLGDRIRAIGVRVSTHPGQYTVLNSPNRSVVEAAVAELEYHARLLDALGTDSDSKIVVHAGGLYGATKREALDRFCRTVRALSAAVRRRLVLENDDRLFNADEVLEAARALGIPVVFDWLHHRANTCRRPLASVVAEVFATWTPADGRPKVHLSSQARGARPGAHADYVRPSDFLALLAVVPEQPFDCMLEAKQKDRALLRLRDRLEQLGIREGVSGASPVCCKRRR